MRPSMSLAALVLAVPAARPPAALRGTELDPARTSSRTSAWTLNANECPAGQRNAEQSECLAAVQEAVQSTGVEVRSRSKTVDSAEVPPGCLYSPVSKMAIFNSKPAGRSSEAYQWVCIERKPAQQMNAAEYQANVNQLMNSVLPPKGGLMSFYGSRWAAEEVNPDAFYLDIDWNTLVEHKCRRKIYAESCQSYLQAFIDACQALDWRRQHFTVLSQTSFEQIEYRLFGIDPTFKLAHENLTIFDSRLTTLEMATYAPSRLSWARRAPGWAERHMLPMPLFHPEESGLGNPAGLGALSNCRHSKKSLLALLAVGKPDHHGDHSNARQLAADVLNAMNDPDVRVASGMSFSEYVAQTCSARWAVVVSGTFTPTFCISEAIQAGALPIFVVGEGTMGGEGLPRLSTSLGSLGSEMDRALMEAETKRLETKMPFYDEGVRFSSFGVIISAANVSLIKAALALPPERIEAMQAALDYVRERFTPQGTFDYMQRRVSTGSPRPSATAPAAAWELGPTAQAQWMCGVGQRNAGASECLAAVVAASGGKASGHFKLVDTPLVPPGCSYSHVSGAALFNSGAGQVGSEEKDYQLVCATSGQSSAASVPLPQPSPAPLAPQEDGKSAGLAVCVTGQLARLELRSKVQNLLAVHGPERAGLFLVLEKGDAVYVNAKTHQVEGGCDVEPTPDEVQEAAQPYLRGALFPKHMIYPVNMSEWPVYRPDLNGHGRRSEHEKLFHLQSHHAQFEHGQECARLMLEEEARTGKRYEAMVRVRDNGVVSARFSPLAITANAGSREVFAKDCNGWGGVSDKVLIVPRDMVESAFMHHFDMMSSILEGPPTAYAQHAATMRGISSRVTTSEKLLLAFLENANLTVSRLSDFIPVIDGRCFNATEPRHVGTTPDPAGKQWCAEPSCKDCNGSALPWDLDGFGFCNTTCDFLMPSAHPMDWADQVSSSVQNAQERQRLEEERAPPPTS